MSTRAQPEVRCPAGSFVVETKKGPGVQCGVETRFIAAVDNPKTVMGYCSTHYDKCPAWIAAKENDPAVDAAQLKPRMRKCPDCEGSGIAHGESFVSGMWIEVEEPCDFCVGKGQVAHGDDVDKAADEDDQFIEALERARHQRGTGRIFVKGTPNG